MKAYRFLVLLTVLTILAAQVGPVHADGSSPWSEILNPDGSIQWSKLTDLGNTSQGASWMDVTLPGGLVLHPDATYHRYRTPSGNVLVLPSPTTLFFMALHPKESGLLGAQSLLGNGAAILTLLVGGAMTPDELAKLVSKGYTDPAQFFQAVIEGRESIWSVLNFTFIFELLKMSFSSGFLVNALLLYLNGAANCASIPAGCTGLGSGDHCENGVCLPEPTLCPPPTIAQGTPVLTIQEIAPAHPLVVGQDPNRRGADIQAAVTIPPVIFTWFEPVQDPPTCRFDGSSGGSGCAGPGSRYSGVFNQGGTSIPWSPLMENNLDWKVVAGAIHCVKHVENLPEPITAVQAAATLSPASRSWIVNDLAGKYYEAYLHRPDFALLPQMAPVSARCDGDSVCSAMALVPRVPFADPGTYALTLIVNTAGTVFQFHGSAISITPPRVLTAENTFQVSVTLVTLVPAGAP